MAQVTLTFTLPDATQAQDITDLATAFGWTSGNKVAVIKQAFLDIAKQEIRRVRHLRAQAAIDIGEVDIT